MKPSPALVSGIASLLLFLAPPGAPAGGTLPITHETLWLLKQVGAPAPSPDGRWVVVSVTEPAYDEKDETADLWIVPGDGSAPPRRLTTAKGTESSQTRIPHRTNVAFS